MTVCLCCRRSVGLRGHRGRWRSCGHQWWRSRRWLQHIHPRRPHRQGDWFTPLVEVKPVLAVTFIRQPTCCSHTEFSQTSILYWYSLIFTSAKQPPALSIYFLCFPWVAAKYRLDWIYLKHFAITMFVLVKPLRFVFQPYKIVTYKWLQVCKRLRWFALESMFLTSVK